MDTLAIEKKWQKKWEDEKLYSFNKKNIGKKRYVLEMFSYPSGAKLHLGHWYNYGLSDSYARFKMMQGYEVFEPMGFDAFGLPAENYAIKNKIHPETSTLKNIDTMEKQLKAMGGMFDWDYEIKTCMPDYYKWTQWIFLRLLEKGLAYRKEAPVNWCPDCNTVLANEQVVDGECERCHTTVIRKNLTQWFFKITDYADELLTGLDTLDWPEKTKSMQRNWIGRSEGGEIEFTATTGDAFKVFTTRADTAFGVSYVVLAPEHPLVNKLTTPAQREAVERYKAECSKATEIDRLSTAREKTGVFTGCYAINPVNDKQIPVWIADYVLYTYGTGAVMGVPAHDERDFLFAKKYDLPITRVICGESETELPYTEYGVLTDSGKFDGMTSAQAISAILANLNEKSKGGVKVNYRLRDWLVSRQRYWGCPIPVVHCEHCGIVPIPDEQLPVLLPKDVEFAPDGKSPLAKHEGYMNAVCPKCGQPARRDPDTLDTFVCSSWYFLRYPDSKNDRAPFDRELINQMLPVDKYIGGAEHACMHLLYARFFTKALRDLGYLDFDEPFTSLIHQGTILGPDGYRMSKSRGNVVSPDIYVNQYGSDVFRLYLMFGFSYTEGGPWNDDGIKSAAKFVDRLTRIILKYKDTKSANCTAGKAENDLNFVLHSTVKQVSADLDTFSFNTAVARLMELVNAMYKYESEQNMQPAYLKDVCASLIKLIAPITPHLAEELWESYGHHRSIFRESYPLPNEAALVKAETEYAVQICSKIKGKINIPSGLPAKEIETLVMQSDLVKTLLGGAAVKKIIVIPDRLINILL